MITQREKDIENYWSARLTDIDSRANIYADGAAFGRKDAAKRITNLLDEYTQYSLDGIPRSALQLLAHKLESDE